MAGALYENLLFYSNGTENAEWIRRALKQADIFFIEFESEDSEIAVVYDGSRYATPQSIRAVVSHLIRKESEDSRASFAY